MLRKIIELHLKGYGYTEISKRTGIARSTVQDAVAKWRSGNTGIFSEAVSYIDDITEIARYMRENGIRLEDVKLPIFNTSVLKSLNIDLQDLYSFYNAIKGYDPDAVPSIADAIVRMKAIGIDPAAMIQKLESLHGEIEELEKRKDSLQSDISEVESDLNIRRKEIESLERNKEELRNMVAALRKEETARKDEIKRDQQVIERSEKFWSLAKRMHLDPAKIEEFIENTISMGYDASIIPGIKEIEKYGRDRSMSRDEMRTLVLSIRQLESAGWSPDSIVKLSMAMRSFSDSPDDVIAHMQKYAEKYRDVNNAMSELKKQIS